MRRFLHLLAAVLFLSLMYVHLEAIFRDILLLHWHNSVFPFLTNRTLFIISAFIDAASIVVCFRFSGKSVADYWLIAFVVLMCWYRFGIYMTNSSGYSCGCLGILTVIFRLSKFQEDLVAYGVLAIFILCSLPGLLSKFAKRFSIERQRVTVLVVAASFFSLLNLKASDIVLQGHYQYTNYNPRTGEAIVHDDGRAENGHYAFSTVLAGNNWSIAVTNLDDSALWTELVYDGTNTYTFNPNRPPFVSPSGGQDAATICVTISPGPYFLPAVCDWAFSYIPWVTYGLNPLKIVPDTSGFIAIPLPWQTPRLKARAYGWNWVIKPSENNRFVASCRVEREYGLDLATESAELLRAEMDYPESIIDKNIYLDSLTIRKQIPDHFLDTQYSCTAWLETNGMKIPVKSEMVQFEHLFHKTAKSPLTRISLTVDSLHLAEQAGSISLPSQLTRAVKDYRFKKSTDLRIFKRAEYTLSAGQAWKSDSDPTLTKQRDDFLKHGRRYDSYDYSSKQTLVWILGLFISMPPMFLLIKHIKKRK